jgi:hypothetical protein
MSQYVFESELNSDAVFVERECVMLFLRLMPSIHLESFGKLFHEIKSRKVFCCRCIYAAENFRKMYANYAGESASGLRHCYDSRRLRHVS